MTESDCQSVSEQSDPVSHRLAETPRAENWSNIIRIDSVISFRWTHFALGISILADTYMIIFSTEFRATTGISRFMGRVSIHFIGRSIFVRLCASVAAAQPAN